MNHSAHLACALGLDAIFGDPWWLPHPVRMMGKLSAAVEGPCRRVVADEKLAGVAAALIVVGVSALVAVTVRGARRLHPRLGDVASIVLLYTTLAARDLSDHAQAVQWALAEEDLPAARRAVARMVGRDTECLDEAGVVRAVVESVAENTVDGVTAPLFYAFLGGAPVAMAFKAASTLDSMFGYKNDRYVDFGWASARLDDLANYVPARLTVPFTALAAGVLGLSPAGVLCTVRRDGRKHPSPNAGLAESAMAGALGVRLGGPLTRAGKTVDAPFLGQPWVPLRRGHISAAVRLMWLTSIFTAVGLALARSAARSSAERKAR